MFYLTWLKSFQEVDASTADCSGEPREVSLDSVFRLPGRFCFRIQASGSLPSQSSLPSFLGTPRQELRGTCESIGSHFFWGFSWES